MLYSIYEIRVVTQQTHYCRGRHGPMSAADSKLLRGDIGWRYRFHQKRVLSGVVWAERSAWLRSGVGKADTNVGATLYRYHADRDPNTCRMWSNVGNHQLADIMPPYYFGYVITL